MNKLTGGIHTNTDEVFDTGFTQPITPRAIADVIKKSIEPLDEVLEILQASAELLKILGTIQMCIEADLLGGRRMV